MPIHSRRRSSGGGGGGGGGGSWGGPARGGRSNASVQDRLAGAGAFAADRLGDGIEAAGDSAQGLWQGLFGGERTPGSGPTGGVSQPAPDTATRGGTALDLLDGDGPLQVADIAQVRAAIEALPEDQRGPLYRTLNAKVGFRNQRDNDSYQPDWACNMTSIAMVLNQLGLGEDDVDGQQFEDTLVDWWRDGKLTAPWASPETQFKAAAEHGADAERQWKSFSGSATAAETWFTETVLPAFERGVGATVGIAYADGSHIVRLQWVEDEGLRVDDPFGALERAADGTYTYYRGASGNQLNAKDETGGAGARGEDNLWSWQTVADTVRYVQWHRPAGVGDS